MEPWRSARRRQELQPRGGLSWAAACRDCSAAALMSVVMQRARERTFEFLMDDAGLDVRHVGRPVAGPIGLIIDIRYAPLTPG